MLKKLLFFLLSLSGLGVFFRKRLFAAYLGLRPAEYDVHVQTGIMIPTPDGIHLATDHYAPQTDELCPTILIRCPYGRNLRGSLYGGLVAFFAYRFAERGYHVLLQDVRGRFDSTGEFEPYLHEKADALATMVWLRAQTWFNGQLATWGASYLGIVQWLAVNDIPEIQAMMPIVTASSAYPIMYHDGVLDYGLLKRWLAIFYLLDRNYHGSYLHGALTLIQLLWNLRQAERVLEINDVDRLLVGQSVDLYQRALANPHQEMDLWQEIHQMVDVSKVQIPVHLIGGWHDFFLREQLKDYARLKANGNTPYLTIGNWHHFHNANGMLSGIEQGIAWFDQHLKGLPASERLPVQLYIMGADEWRDYPDFPPPTTTLPYYLAQNGLELSMPSAGERGYTYDLHNPTPALGGAQFDFNMRPVRDNRLLTRRQDVLSFDTAPLEQDVEFIGTPRVLLFVQSSEESVDFFVRLCDVFPDGRAMNITDGFLRLAAGATQLQQIEIDFHPSAYRLKQGHRLQLILASGAHPRWLRNGYEGEFRQIRRFKTSEQVIFYGEQYPSQVLLPQFC